LLSNNQCAAGHAEYRDRIKSIAVAAILLPLRLTTHVKAFDEQQWHFVFVITLKTYQHFVLQ
jgi:hypothetical protein